MPFFVVTKGPDKGREVELPEDGDLLVGRSPHGDLTLHEMVVSRRHFRVFMKDDEYVLEDLDSVNGTLVNEEKVQRKFLQPGDIIRVGESQVSYLSDQEYRQQGGRIGKTIGGYRLLERIGEGGMGVVYKAVQLRLQRYVALKLLSKEKGENQRDIDRFIQEARSAARLNHPNVVQIFDVDQEEGVYYISMEYIPGGSVKDFLRRQGTITAIRAAEMIRDAAKGLSYAKKKSLVHRDIKPDNLMIADDGTVKIIDLGVAKGLNDVSQESDNKVFGTPQYIAPEQARKQEIDIRADIYALGSTFFRMVTGKRPFTGDSLKDVIRKKIQQSPPPPGEVRADVPDWMDQLIVRMMEPDRSERIQTPQKIIDHIEKQLSGTTERPSGEQQPMFSSTKQPMAFLISVCVLLLVGGGIIYFQPMRGNNNPQQQSKTVRSLSNSGNQKNAEQRAEFLGELSAKSRLLQKELGRNLESASLETVLDKKQDAKNFLSFARKKKEILVTDKEQARYQKLVEPIRKQHLQLEQMLREKRKRQLLQKRRDIVESLKQLHKRFDRKGEVEVKKWKKQLKNLSDVVDRGRNDSLKAETKKIYEQWEQKWNSIQQYQKIRKQVLKTIDNQHFSRAFQLIDSKKSTFSSQVLLEKLRVLQSKLEDQELVYYEEVIQKVERLQNQNLYKKAISTLQTAQETIYTPALQTKLQERLTLVRRKKQYFLERKKQEKEEKKRKENIEKEKAKLIGKVSRMLKEIYHAGERPRPLSLSEQNFLTARHEKIFQFYRFLQRRYNHFWERFLTKIKNGQLVNPYFVLSGGERGPRQITGANRKTFQLKLQKVSGYRRLPWSQVPIREMLKFAYENWEGFNAEDYLDSSVMYYLYRGAEKKQDLLERAKQIAQIYREKRVKKEEPEQFLPEYYRRFIETGHIPENLRTFQKKLMRRVYTRLEKSESESEFRAWLPLLENGFSQHPLYHRLKEKVSPLRNQWKNR